VTEKTSSVVSMNTLDHIAWLVKDARKTAAAYEKMLGIGPWSFHERGSKDANGKRKKEVLIAYAYTQNGVELELIQILKDTQFHSDFAEKHGEGLYHLGFKRNDVLGETAELVAHGAKVVFDLGKGCQYLRFPDDGGLITELYWNHPPFLEDKLIPDE